MDSKLNLHRDQIAHINDKRAIKHGWLKLIIGLCVAAACGLVGVQAIAYIYNNGLHSFWSYYSGVYLTMVILVCMIYWPFKGFWRFFEVNVRGWWLIYARCHSHDVYALALKSPTGEITWIVPLVRNIFHTASERCVYTNFLFIPLGGWGKRPFIHQGHQSELTRMPNENTYKGGQWKVEVALEDPICEWTRVWLTDTNASRVMLRVWDALTIAHEVVLSSGNKWFGEHAMRFLRQRDEAHKAARDLFGDLLTTERAMFNTRRFVRSKQGLQVRLSLLLAIQQRLRELDRLGIRPMTTEEAQRIDNDTAQAHRALDALSAAN